MPKDNKPTYRSQFDGHRRLAAAVILQAIKDADSSSSTKDRETANAFLKSNMWPFSDVLDLPTDNNGLSRYLNKLGHLPEL
ncbi:MAG: hypothetical protein VX294_05305 [Candidatus Latescibacterota bacterium]|nr:hypothetical protein [Candidatus Latescibacterota bacterium]